MEALLRSWDGEGVFVHHDPPTDSWIFIAIHSTRLGPAVGGTRMKPYPEPRAALADALRLAAGMTYKFAVPGLPYGGGKAVLAVPPDLAPESRPDLLRRYGALVHGLRGLYSAAPDVGVTSHDMDVIGETAAPYVFGRTPAAGGCGPSGPATALGVFAAIQVACEQLFGDGSVRGRRVLVQGAGSVGAHLLERLSEAGAEVLFNDVDARTVQRLRDEKGLSFVPENEVFGMNCDIFAPCALGGILDAQSIPRLRCRAVVGGANNQLREPQDAERLRARGILYAPDYVANVGGAMAGLRMEVDGWSRERAEREVTERVQQALRRVFEMADAEGITTDAAARRLAEERLASRR